MMELRDNSPTAHWEFENVKSSDSAAAARLGGNKSHSVAGSSNIYEYESLSAIILDGLG